MGVARDIFFPLLQAFAGVLGVMSMSVAHMFLVHLPSDAALVERTDAAAQAQRAERRNTRSKINQRRYRAEKKLVDSHRIERITALRKDVVRLEGYVASLCTKAKLRTFEPEMRVMAEYFRLFAQGYKGGSDGRMDVVQHDFLVSAMHEDMVFMEDIGVKKLIAQWKIYDSIFDSFAVEAQAIDVVAFTPNVIVRADANMNLRLSRRTIETLFRHLLGDEPLTQRLIGQVLELPMQMRFVFDADMKVLRYDTHVNIVLGLTKLLGSLEDTVAVLQHFEMRENAEVPVHEGRVVKA
ncbi:Aste57867_1430 [Aphanomyces stellatus]|uniref:Aste57867_1430 protein n=1 Tax=Aphanomyces stellatus TaxID=120398 RepID=A0A485K8J1_9STRA|nr:hypothetical protein As57867_001429 [Aphanomyces stellatus]VFT78647.1 Aste57867_1430 [Aphanomyces stellatus]